MTDLEKIKRLESEIGHTLKRKGSDLDSISDLYYSIDADKTVKSIRLRNISLQTFPQSLLEFNELEDLKLSQNKLKEVPPEISKMKSLKYLSLARNDLRSFPSQLLDLNGLCFLNLAGCGIKSIPGDINWLKELDELLLFENGIEHIPTTLFECNNLKKLMLSYNKIADFPNIEGSLNRIEVLSLGNNKIESIPENINELKSIRWLGLNKNKIRELPRSILDLRLNIKWKYESRFTGRGIILENNPLINPSPEIIKQGNKAIREYFEQREKSGTEQLNEAKLILLGDGRSGKTSFANRLLNKELPKEKDRTQGVDIIIGEYAFPIANGSSFKINIWDFAGQDKYKKLHQLFYTESSLYVMVAESGNTTVDYDDWFQTAELFGEGSPLVLILNEFKSGIGTGSFDINYWKKQFPELLKEVFTINLGTKQNFSTAEEYIRFIAQTLPHTKYPFPSNWAAIRRVLHERREEQYIPLKEYFEICKQNDLPQPESALILSSVLHKIGDCLHYQKNELLKQFIILKNEWATEAVYKILDDEVVAKSKCGFFDQSDVKRIWNDGEYEHMRPQLLELMKQFKLAYQLPSREEYVTPPLLPPAPPENYSWPDVPSLELYIDYDFLPKVLLTQFIVTRHADISKGRKLVWRHGVILEWKNEALGEVSKTRLEGRDAFYIRTQGRNRKEMLTIILKTFRELHAEYKGIKYREKVPCVCEGCKTGANKQHYFDFETLNRRLEKGRFEVECDNSLEKLNVLELLENTFVFEQYKEGSSLQLKGSVERESAPEIRILKIFLASSNELEKERIQIEQALNRKNKLLRKKGIVIELLIWEDGKIIGQSLRSQDDYNVEIRQCDFFTMLFYSKVGKYSFEEFTLAKTLFEEKGMPRLRIFQKDVDLPKNLQKRDADSRYDFLEKLKELEHFPVPFQNTDQLVNELEDAIDKLLADEAFVKQLKCE
ncbi:MULTISPECIES: COR domain-containing protein [Niastella]|uniref:Leucine-rich repeat domain-containing protein n=1 Tax=Niastella soli TaxID=2821487 RepID=A0ABS3YVU4_9BACT|nr:COR domain-containing protein [Niastella soli]MBO9202027.1 leucine-rich repeat domain-containing protein [Niastella soli]